MKVGYLGPKGTFSEQAAIILASGNELVPYKSFPDCLEAVEKGEVDEAVVPLENSIEGVVNTTIDELIFNLDLYVREMLLLPITQNLMVRPGVKLEDITTIVSHPHAIPQCNIFLKDNLHEVQRETTSSTGKAAELVSKSEEPIAAIGNKRAAEINGLEIICPEIQDNKDNHTNFARVSKTPCLDYENADAVMVAFATKHEPGALFKVLEIFSVLDVNLFEIFSRPFKDRPTEYIFVINIQITNNVDDVKEAVRLLERKTDMVKMLGVYNIR